MPFLVEAQHLSRGAAGSLLTVVVLANMAFGLLFGQLISRHHGLRLPIALGVVAATAGMWAVVLGWPGGHDPLWLLVLLCLVLGADGPASMIGFDFARPANPPERFGTASGIVNIGGFVASVLTLLAIGVLLDASGGDYRLAWCSVFVLQAAGLTQILRLRRASERLERERIAVSRVESVHRTAPAMRGGTASAE
jgi:MFS family permease